MRALTRPRVLTTLMLAGLGLAVWCTPAQAHARLLQESPASGASLEESPEQVRLRFSEPVDAEFDPLRVFDAEGDRVDEDDARADPDDARVLVVGLENLPRGSWTATSSRMSTPSTSSPTLAKPRAAQGVRRRRPESRRHNLRQGRSQNGRDHRTQAGWIKP